MSVDGKGCFKRGCLGCLALILIAVIVGAVIALLAAREIGREPEPVQLDQVQNVPEFPLPLGAPGDFPERGGLPAIDLEALQAVEVSEPGRVILDVARVDFSIEPGPPGSSIRVEGGYDSAGYVMEQDYEEYGEDGWIYRLKFRPTGVLNRISYSSNGTNIVRLILPRESPISLEGTIGVGESKLELGGLWIVNTDLGIGAGEHSIRFSEPLLLPMGQFRVDASIGSLGVRGLGNASPTRIQIDQNIGETYVDLRGSWRNDATVSVTCGIGECKVHLPDRAEAAVELFDVGVTIGESDIPSRRNVSVEEQEGLPKIKLSARGTLGEVKIN